MTHLRLTLTLYSRNTDHVTTFSPLECRLADRCSGCTWIGRPYSEQIHLKIQSLKNAWDLAGVPAPLPEVRFVGIASGGLRDRADLIIDWRSGDYRLGLFATGADQEIVDIDFCPQMSSQLNILLNKFRSFRPRLGRGSVRLRVSPAGEFAVWLDFSNIDIKNLLENRTDLDRLRQFAFVEIGQKRKTLIERDGRLKLGDPLLRPWFETYVGPEERPTPVFCTVGGFTQPGFTANRVLVREVRSALGEKPLGRVAEFGSGYGNFTLPLASMAETVDAYEVDELACEGLRLGAETANLTDRLHIHRGNYQLLSPHRRPEFSAVDCIVVDPPRSGLKNFLDPLAELPQAARPRKFLYISCFAQSFAQDSRKLVELGYQPILARIVDQFPQSPHYEIVALFEK